MQNNETKTTNAVAKTNYRTGLVKITETYTNMIIGNFKDIQLELDSYQKVCLANAIAKIQELLYANKLDFNSDAINQNNLTTVLSQIAMFRLNPAASPRECYFQLRNNKADGKKIIEFGIEGSGNDAILRNYGVNVKAVSTPIIVREGDEFTYPYFDGEKMQPFTWKPNSFYKKPIAVVYVIVKNDDTKEYLVSEREAVATNLKAHISNNMLTCKDFKFKKKILEKIKDMTLDEMLTDSELTNSVQVDGDWINLISPAWKSEHSKDAMILRKMQNNAIKKYPKDFKSSYVESKYESTFEDYDQYKKDAIDVKSEEFKCENLGEVAQQQLANNGSVHPPKKEEAVVKPTLQEQHPVQEEEPIEENNMFSEAEKETEEEFFDRMIRKHGDH